MYLRTPAVKFSDIPLPEPSPELQAQIEALRRRVELLERRLNEIEPLARENTRYG